MGKRSQAMRRIGNDQNGFTLVELMVTITILAIITIPLLSYFSDAAAHNAESRTKQDAVVMAQDVLEKFKSAKYEITSPGAVVLGEPNWVASIPDANGVYTVTKSVNMDNRTFQVSSEITPVNSQVNLLGDTVDYKRSVIGSMDTSKDVMSTETGHAMMDAVLYYYGIHSTSCETSGTVPDTSEELSKFIDGIIHVDIKTDPTKAENLVIRIYYEYTFSSARYQASHGSPYPEGITVSTASYQETVESVSLNAAEMNNIYLFYKPMGLDDSIVLTDNSDAGFNSNVATDQLNLFLIAQSSVIFGETLPDPSYTNRAAGYKLYINSSGAYFTNKVGKVYTNLSSSASELQAGALSTKVYMKDGKYSLVDEEDADRLADIKVTVTCNSKEYANVAGSKVQN